MPGKGHRFTAKEHRQVEHIKDSEVEPNKHVEGDARRRYTAKERRQAEHIAQSEEARGTSPDEAKSIAYATVNKLRRS